jgi:hypothetical protein
MGSQPNRITKLGQSLAIFGVLLMAIRFGLTAFDIAGGGSSLMTFAAGFFILLGVAMMFRSGSLRQ